MEGESNTNTHKKFFRKENGSDSKRKIKVETEREERPEAEVLATEMGVLALPLVVVAALLPLVVVAELAAALPPKNKNHIYVLPLVVAALLPHLEISDDNQICSQNFHRGAVIVSGG